MKDIESNLVLGDRVELMSNLDSKQESVQTEEPLPDSSAEHLPESTIMWQKRSNCLGIPYIITIVHGDEVKAEQLIASDPKYHDIEEYLADAGCYAMKGQWEDVALSASAAVAEWTGLEWPDSKPAVETGLDLVMFIATKDWTKLEAAALELGVMLTKLNPNLGVEIVTRATPSPD